MLLLDLNYDPRNAIAVGNPLEKMLTFADAATSDAASVSSPLAMVGLLLEGLGSVLARYTFVLHPSARPTVFLSWLIVAGIVMAWRRGERPAALQALVLLLGAIAIDTVGVRAVLNCRQIFEERDCGFWLMGTSTAVRRVLEQCNLMDALPLRMS